MRRIARIVVHCAATPPSADIGRKEIDRWHRTRGFLCIGYHYVIRRDGTVEEGRPEEQIGAHAEGFNKDSIAICLVGGVAADCKTPEANFTPAQFASLKLRLSEFAKKYPQAEVLGHRDLPRVAKACPSFDVREWLKTGAVK